MLFCPICGGPIRPPAPSTGESWSDEIKWQTKAVLLSDPDGEFETVEQHYVGGKRSGIAQLHTNFDAVILQERATATWSNTCIYEESGHEISPYWMAGYDEFGAPYNVPYSIATHEACVQIAQMVMRRSQNNVHVRSMRTLWKVLRSRRDARDNEYMVTVQEAGPQYIVMDHGYYMPPGYADDYSLGNGDDTHWVVANPTDLQELTSQILTNVEILQATPVNSKLRDFHTLFSSLPQELKDRVLSFLCCPEGLPTGCTALLPQEAWLCILLEGKCLPFLWSLDIDAVEAFHNRSVQDGTVLNWELLVRKLSQGVSITRKHHGSLEAKLEILCYPHLDVSKELRNRRRIWQLVEEMYVGDVLPVCRSWGSLEQKPTMPLYWDEYGNSRFPIVRVTGVAERNRPA